MVKEKAYAKINLFLDVLSKREDNFHNLETVMAPIEFHDTLVFEKTSRDSIEIISNVTITEKPQDNLVYQVAEFMLKEYGINRGVKITIDKQIPIAAGLAGGSADAAATLRGLNKLFKLKLSLQELEKLGEQFGSDVPYCVYNKLCIARGKGEQLFFLKNALKCPVLIIVPHFKVSTKEVYHSVKMDEVPIQKITRMSNAIYNQNYELMTKELYNALEPFAFKLFPDLQKLKEDIMRFSLDGVLMSGSGPAIFIFHKNKKDLLEIQNAFTGKNTVILTKIKA